MGESLKEYLENNGIKCLWINSERKLEEALSLSEFDVSFFDLILKYSKGEDTLKNLRDKNIKTPIMIMTAKSSIKDKETCFSLGADDYIVKPFDPKELLLRIKALSK